MDFIVRPLKAEDSIRDLTLLLNRAYKELADMGLRFVATYQDESITRSRIERAECYVAEVESRIVGSILFRDCARTGGCPWYDRPEVASFGQFGVEPALKGKGVGSALLKEVEIRARETGAQELGLDTALPATHLIELYERKGYRVVDEVQWDVTNYRSVIMSKAL